MATTSFSRDIIINSSKAIHLLKASLKDNSSQSVRKVTPKGSKTVSPTQVKDILQEF